MTLHPALPTRAPDMAGPMHCFRCGVSAHDEPTVYARITIHGERQAPLCVHCASKLDRMSRLARRGECAE